MTLRFRRLAALSLAALLTAGAVGTAAAQEFTSSELGDLTDMLAKSKAKKAAAAKAKTAAATPKSTAKAKASTAALPSKAETRLVTNEVLVETKPNITPAELTALATRNNLRLIETADIALLSADVHRFEITDKRSLRVVLTALGADPLVLLAQPNYAYELTDNASSSAPPVQTAVPQYAADELHLTEAHTMATGRAIKIGILDTAIADTPELDGSVAVRADLAGPTPTDDVAHGTALAGIIAAHHALIGVAPAAALLSARAFVAVDGKPPASNSFVLLKGLDWLAGNGVQIVNMSFAGPSDPLFLKSLKAAHDKGILAVAAAGNDGPKAAPDFPAADPSALGVTAIDDADAILPQANQGSYVAVAAPGVDVLVLAPDGSYDTSSGTSIAAAHVSGAAALLLEKNPGLKPDDLIKLLMATALDLGPKGRDKTFGAGLIDPQKALLPAQ